MLELQAEDRRVSVHCHQVGHRPPRGHVLRAPIEGMSIDNLGGLCASQRIVFPTLFVCALTSSSFLAVSVVAM